MQTDPSRPSQGSGVQCDSGDSNGAWKTNRSLNPRLCMSVNTGPIPKALCPRGGRGKLRHKAPGARHAHTEGTAVTLVQFGAVGLSCAVQRPRLQPGKGVAGPLAAPEGARASLPAPVANQPLAGAARERGRSLAAAH